MKPSWNLSAKSNKGAITITSKDCCYKLVVLGSSCPASVSHFDMPVDTFVVVPKNENEVLAIGYLRWQESGCHQYVSDVYLLHLCKKDEKVSIDLENPLACAADAVGQMIISPEKDKFFLRAKIHETYVTSMKWSTKELKENPGIDPDELCRLIAQALNAPEVPVNQPAKAAAP